jgi:hypothetical protein
LIPFVNLTFPFATIDIYESLASNIKSLDITAQVGTVVSYASSALVDTSSIHVTTGGIRGQFNLLEKLDLFTSEGFLEVTVVAETSNFTSSKGILNTRADDGPMKVALLAPLKHRTQIESHHTARTTGMRLVYPREWEGIVEARTESGFVTMKGEGLKFIDSSPRYKKAVKGDNFDKKGTIDISNLAGPVTFILS